MKFCVDPAHKNRAYNCARCNRTHCSECDLASDAQEIKTMVRWCPDWRCQREKMIEEGKYLVTDRDGGST